MRRTRPSRPIPIAGRSTRSSFGVRLELRSLVIPNRKDSTVGPQAAAAVRSSRRSRKLANIDHLRIIRPHVAAAAVKRADENALCLSVQHRRPEVAARSATRAYQRLLIENRYEIPDVIRTRCFPSFVSAPGEGDRRTPENTDKCSFFATSFPFQHPIDRASETEH